MADLVDCCRVWESHREVEIEPRTSANRHPAHAICQVTVDEQAPAASPEMETLEDIIRKLLPTPALPPLQAVPIPSDRDLLIQRLMVAICPPKPVAQERSTVTELETMLLNWLPVGTVTEEAAASPNPSADSAEGCFPCGVLIHTTEQCQTLDESFPFCLRDGRRNASETSSSWDRVLKRGPRASRWETPTDPGRGVGCPDQ